MRTGLGEFLGEGTIVGHEEQTFAGIVEAANRIDAFGLLGEEIHDGGAAFGIADGGDITFRLVEEEIDEGLGRFKGWPSTQMTSRSGSALVPCSVTTAPLSVTRPAAMISSALRREAMPAAARIFWRRSGMAELSGIR